MDAVARSRPRQGLLGEASTSGAPAGIGREREVGSLRPGEPFGQGRRGVLLGGENRVTDRPIDADGRVVPADSPLRGAVICARGEVLDPGDLGQDAEAPGEAGRSPQLARLFGIPFHTNPATERWRPDANVRSE